MTFFKKSVSEVTGGIELQWPTTGLCVDPFPPLRLSLFWIVIPVFTLTLVLALVIAYRGRKHWTENEWADIGTVLLFDIMGFFVPILFPVTLCFLYRYAKRNSE